MDTTPVEETNLPRYVIYRGRKARVTEYMPATQARGARFIIIDHEDQERSVARESITFLKGN